MLSLRLRGQYQRYQREKQDQRIWQAYNDLYGSHTYVSHIRKSKLKSLGGHGMVVSPSFRHWTWTQAYLREKRYAPCFQPSCNVHSIRQPYTGIRILEEILKICMYIFSLTMRFHIHQLSTGYHLVNISSYYGSN